MAQDGEQKRICWMTAGLAKAWNLSSGDRWKVCIVLGMQGYRNILDTKHNLS